MKLLEKQISTIINNAFNLQVDCEVGTEFAWYNEDNVLTFPPYWIDETTDYTWAEWIEKHFGVLVDHDFCYYLSFLHELGHKITLKDISEPEYNHAEDITDLNEYFNTKREYKATEWAIKMLIHQEKAVNAFWEQTSKALQDFYIRNEIS